MSHLLAPEGITMNGTPETETAPSRPPVERLTYRLEELAEALGISRRVLERERSAGRLLKPDLRIGRMPLWSISRVKDWIARGGRGT